MDLQLAGRTALVTGAASGIGLACAQALLDEGARVVIADRSNAGADTVAALVERGRDATFVRTDVTDEADVVRAIDATATRFGGLDVLVGCAGISGPVGRSVADVAVADWDAVMAVNVRGNFLVTKHAAHHLTRSDVGTVVYLASDSALVAFQGMGAYNASKGALVMLTKSVAVDFPGLRANALCPGIVDTPMSRADLGMPDGFDGSDLPVAQPAQLARHVAFLASPVSAPINGTTLVADFGYLARSAVGTLGFFDP